MINSTEYGPNDFLDIHNVRIRPSMMLFKNAFEGRSYTAKLSIQNIGNVKVMVKVTSPTSYAFHIKSMTNAVELPPGLSIFRTVKYKYSIASMNICHIPIHINEHTLEYQIKVETSEAAISISPDILDFGIIDAGLTSAIRTIRLKNDGNCYCHFYLDMPKSKPKLVVEPSRGQIPANSFVEISIKLVSYKAGKLDTEMWIKCKTPIRIPVRGQIIQSTFEPIYPTATETFTVIDFPPTYVGVKTTKNMLIKNFSSLCNMFCVSGEINRESVSLDVCRENYYYYNYFDILPTEGRFEPHESKLFQFSTMCCDGNNGCGPDHPMLMPDISEIGFKPTIADFEQPFVRIYLHATPENPSVEVTPTEIVLTGLSLGVKTTRVLELKNNSNNLPIILHYKKVPYIDVARAVVFLKPSAKIQIAIYITPYKYGQVSTRVAFDLLFYDCPKIKEDTYTVIGHVQASVQFHTELVTKYSKPELNPGLDPNYLRSVGTFCQDITFNTFLSNSKCVTVDGTLSGPKDELVAFPNDTQRSLRPWRSNLPCRTMFTHQPRYTPPPDKSYEISIHEKQVKSEIAVFYTNFIREEAQRLRQMSIKELDPLTDYALTIGSKLLCESPRHVQCTDVDVKGINSDSCFIPLTAAQMNKVMITPTFIDTGSIAARHSYEFKIRVSNKNSFPIRIFVRSDKTSILFPKGNRRDVKRNSETDVVVTYMQDTIGYYVLALDLVVNECMFITVTVVANVVPGIIPLTTTDIEFQENITYRYYDMKNNLNVPINFQWNASEENFAVKPNSGVLAAGCLTTCIITCLPHFDGNNVADLDLITDQINLQRIRLTSNISPTNVVLMSKLLKFKDMALNRPLVQKVMIHNRHSYAVGYQVLDCGLGDIVLVAPVRGVIAPFAKCSVAIRIMMPHCVKFKTKLRIKIIHADILELDIEGNVVYPHIKILPKVLQFGKVTASTTDRVKFVVTNTSKNEVALKFDMCEHQEYKISEEQYYWSPAAADEYVLDTRESKLFYLHFLPLEISSSVFYLPVILNSLIGPPVYTDPITTKIDYYLKKEPPNTTIIHLPKQIICVKVVGYAVAPNILLSSQYLKFKYFPQLPRLSKKTNKLTLTNNENTTEEVCIRTDHIEDPFHIDNIEAKNVQYHEKAIVLSIPPNSTAVLNIAFNPHGYCEVESFLPLYVRSECTLSNKCMIYLSGEYESPLIMGEKSTFYCKPYPLEYTAVHSKVIKFKNHFKNCKVSTYTNLAQLTMELKKDTYAKISDTEYEMECIFKTRFSSNIKFCNVIKLYCTCGSSWQSDICGCAENCLLTNYAFADTFLPSQLAHQILSTQHQSLGQKSSIYSMFDYVSGRICTDEQYYTSTFFTSYPFFPFDDTFDTHSYVNTDLTTFLLGVVEAAEMWFSSQAMFGSVYYSIPNGINFVSFDEDKLNGRSTEVDIPFVNGLINLAGDQIKQMLPLSPLPANQIEKAYYLYKIYEILIDFLRDLGAYITYLQPEFLLPYTVFVTFQKHILPSLSKKSWSIKVHSFPLFFNLAKQSWTDLLLQTYKVLYLFRLQEQLPTKPSEIEEYNSVSQKKIWTKEYTSFCATELILIKWLEFHYNANKKKLWDGKCTEEKQVHFFGNDLKDGLVFAAITATYCPYLRRYYKTMYCQPTKDYQLYHNNIIVVRCWDMLNCIMSVTVDNLIDPNCVRTLMLVAYLYAVLPSMHPNETIELKANLSQKKSVDMTLENTNEFPIVYIAIMFDNEDMLFTLSKRKMVIKPHHSCVIKITFFAKFVKPTKAYLLLSGECRGYHYAKNKCVALVGTPNIAYPTSTFQFSFPLYSSNLLDINIQSPYKIRTSYFVKLIATANEERLNEAKYACELPFLGNARYNISKKKVDFDENGQGQITIQMSVLFYLKRIAYLYFLNVNEGDFMVKLLSHAKLPEAYENVGVMIPKRIDGIVQKKIRIYLEIPSKNNALLNTISKGIAHAATGNELKFWNINGKTIIGMHLMEKLAGELQSIEGMQNDFCNSKIYKIVLDSTSFVTLPDTITLGGECSSGTVKIPLTLQSSVRIAPKSFSFSLVSTDGLSRRNYVARLTFYNHHNM